MSTSLCNLSYSLVIQYTPFRFPHLLEKPCLLAQLPPAPSLLPPFILGSSCPVFRIARSSSSRSSIAEESVTVQCPFACSLRGFPLHVLHFVSWFLRNAQEFKQSEEHVSYSGASASPNSCPFACGCYCRCLSLMLGKPSHSSSTLLASVDDLETNED